MFDTLQKKCEVETLSDYVLSNDKLAKSVVSKYCTKQLATFERSNENITQSIVTYYSSGVMGKRKYQSVRLALSMKSREGKEGSKTAISLFPGGCIPKILTYNKLVKELNKIDTGHVYEIDECVGSLELDACVSGAYRDPVEYLPRLAKSYLTTNRGSMLCCGMGKLKVHLCLH